MSREREKGLDEEALQVVYNSVSDIPRKYHSEQGAGGGDNVDELIVYEERQMNPNMAESVLAIAKRIKYDMFLVGRGRFRPSPRKFN